jgi:NADPH:quinone reductase-like Zn-dependent oxidoreductase
MKAAVYTKYGLPEVVQIIEIQKPVPNDNEVLVKVHATSLNRTDCGFRKPEYPFIIKLINGFSKPKRAVLGSEFAGEIESVGNNVSLFKKGDQVFGLTGDKFGAHAEYLSIPEDASITLKPSNMNYEEAAAVCDGLMLAFSYLKRTRLKKGQRILVNGASGSIGIAGVQLAKYYEAYVTAVTNTKNLKLAKSLGADEVIDYTKEDFTKSGQTYDFIFDAVGKSSFFRCKKLLRKDGVYFSTDLGFLAQNPLLAIFTKISGSRKVIFPMPRAGKEDITFFKELIEAGKYKAIIDRQYPLEQIVEAYRYVDLGQKTGNVVISVTDQN